MGSAMREERATYRIRIRGHLGRHAEAWFEGWDVAPTEDGDTVLTGPALDQAELHRWLRKVRDLGLLLVALVREPVAPAGGPGKHA